MYWFTSDEHYGHEKIIKYSNRPFINIKEMNGAIIDNFNSKVSKDDITIHAGDFCWSKNQREAHFDYISKLNGSHIFLVGSHDHWLPSSAKYIWRKRFNGNLLVVCHYAMRTWECSHYNSWQLFGHSHGRLETCGKQYDIGVDNNNYSPVSYNQIKQIMKNKPDNFNLIRKENSNGKNDQY